MVNMAEICVEHKGLVYHIAKQYVSVCAYDRAVDIEDLAQAGYIGLMQAVQTYDKSKGAFSTWAAIYIKLEMRKVLGINRGVKRADQGAASLDEVILGAEDSTLLDSLEAPDDTEGEYDHRELVQGVHSIVDTLPELQRTLIRWHDLQGQNLSAAGRSCGLTPSAANQTHHKAIQNLRRNPRMRALAKAHHLDRATSWYQHVGYRTIPQYMDKQHGGYSVLAGEVCSCSLIPVPPPPEKWRLFLSLGTGMGLDKSGEPRAHGK